MNKTLSQHLDPSITPKRILSLDGRGIRGALTLGYLKKIETIITPLLAALLAIIGGFAQSFHWGAAWRDLVMNYQKLEKGRDLFLAIKPAERDLKNELDIMHGMVIKGNQRVFPTGSRQRSET